MAITIDYLDDVTPQFVINIPKADMTLIQVNPSEVRELDIDSFRLILHALQASEDGIAFSTAFEHTQPFTISGVTLARVLEIFDPYVVQFEDGLYNVNVTGGNSNISDKTIKNQVGVNTANSAGLVQITEIEHASFNGEVTIDIANGTAGTLYPAGTKLQPVNNLADALLIDAVRGFGRFFFIGDATIDAGGDYRSLVFVGQSQTKTLLTIDPNAQVDNTEFEFATVTGTLDGGAKLTDCRITTLDYVDGFIERCLIEGTITLSGVETAQFLDCWSGVPGSGTPVIDMGGSGTALGMRNYNGGIELTNKNGSEAVSIDMNSGQIILDATVTNGIIMLRGVGKLTDNSVGATVLADDLLSPSSISTEVKTEAHLAVAYDDTAGSESLDMEVWLTRGDLAVTDPTAMTLVWRDSGGATIFSLTEADATLNAQGHYVLTRAEVLAGDAIYTVACTVTDAIGTESNERSVVTV